MRIEQCSGFPGPLLIKRPSNLGRMTDKSKFQGTTVTQAPLSAKHLIWEFFTPQSTHRMFTAPSEELVLLINPARPVQLWPVRRLSSVGPGNLDQKGILGHKFSQCSCFGQ